MRFTVALICLILSSTLRAQSTTLPDVPQPSPSVLTASNSLPPSLDASPASAPAEPYSSSSEPSAAAASSSATLDVPLSLEASQFIRNTQAASTSDLRANAPRSVPLDADGKPVPLELQQPQRILGFMPNFRSVSAGSKPHPPGWKYNFTTATHQATDYSSFLFLGLTSLFAEGLNEHPSLGKGPDGFYEYAWRGFIDKTDGTYLSAWLLPSLLHEDTRFYPLGHGHSIAARELYIIDRQAITRTYGGSPTPNFGGLGGKALTQYISRFYYPVGSSSFGPLAEKFGYAVMRDVIFTNIREFYPDIAAHYIRRHREKVDAQAARDANLQTP